MKVQAGTYTAKIDGDTLELRQDAERHIYVVEVVDGEVTEKQVPYSSIGPGLAKSPILAATWAGDRAVNVDLDCGAQRWNGVKTMIWLRKGLIEIGFDRTQVDAIFREMRKGGPQRSVRRYW